MADPHDTMELAALAGMDSCKRSAPREFECGFGVYQDKDGKFYHTAAQSGGQNGIEGMSLRIPKTAALVAFGHTHPKTEHMDPSADTSNAFSKEDLEYAKKNKMLMFMGSEKTGQVVRYQHGVTKTDRTPLGRISYGTPVGPYGLDSPDARAAQLASAYDLHNPPPPK